jgi:hypothetical protein
MREMTSSLGLIYLSAGPSERYVEFTKLIRRVGIFWLYLDLVTHHESSAYRLVMVFQI